MDSYGVRGSLVKMEGVCPRRQHYWRTSSVPTALAMDTEGNMIGLHSLQ